MHAYHLFAQQSQRGLQCPRGAPTDGKAAYHPNPQGPLHGPRGRTFTPAAVDTHLLGPLPAQRSAEVPQQSHNSAAAARAALPAGSTIHTTSCALPCVTSSCSTLQRKTVTAQALPLLSCPLKLCTLQQHVSLIAWAPWIHSPCFNSWTTRVDSA
jgi:hypothetical protein